jgi:hypothetical protein
MSTDLHGTGHDTNKPPSHGDVSFEKSDVRTSSIFTFLAFMGITIVAAYIICIFVLRVTTRSAEESYTAPPPIRESLGPGYKAYPPEPRLQGVPGHDTDPQQDMRNKIKEDSEANEKYGWVDEKAGVAQIPVKEAMKIVAEKGLPGVAAAPAEKKK